MQTITLFDQVQRFLAIKPNAQTREWYRKNLMPMVDCLGAGRALETVSRQEAEDYWMALQNRTACWESHPMRPTRSQPLSPTSLKNFLRAARTFWGEMVRQRLCDLNPFDHIRQPHDNRPPAMKAIRAEDLRDLWSAARCSGSRDFAIVTVLATTGLRAGELASMKVSELNLQTGEAWVAGKRGYRQIFLGKASVDAIRHYLPERRSDQGPWLWVSQHGGRLTEDGVRRLIYKLAEQAQVTGRHNLHAFRHRVAQAWLDSGVVPEIVSQVLGHANVSVTLTIYGNQDRQRVRRAVLQTEMAPFVDVFAQEALGG